MHTVVDGHPRASTEQMWGDTDLQFCTYTCTELPRVPLCCHFTTYYSFPEKKSVLGIKLSAHVEKADVKEQSICIKFCFRLNKTATETYRMLKEAFGEQALSQARTFEWFQHFKDGWESVEDRKHSGRPSTCTTPEMNAKVHEIILEDRRHTIHDVCNRVGLSYGSCQRILADELNLRRIATKFVPRLLDNDQRDHRVQVCTEL